MVGSDLQFDVVQLSHFIIRKQRPREANWFVYSLRVIQKSEKYSLEFLAPGIVHLPIMIFSPFISCYDRGRKHTHTKKSKIITNTMVF